MNERLGYLALSVAIFTIGLAMILFAVPTVRP